MRLFDDGVKKMEQSGDADGLVKRLVMSEGRFGGMNCTKIIDALARLGPAAIPGLVSALDEGHPGVPAALAKIGPPALPALVQPLRTGSPDAQIGAALAILMMRIHGDSIDAGVLDQLERLRGTSQYVQVVAFAIAALRPQDKAGTSGYYKAVAPKRTLVEYQLDRHASWRWADGAAFLAYQWQQPLRREVSDNVMIALHECEQASRASS